MIEIRPASPNDAPEMARVTVDTWFAAHEGQVSDESFRKRREEWGYLESEKGWRRSIREAAETAAYVLVATDDGRVVAVAASEPVGIDAAEVGALYISVPYQRLGIGSRLLAAVGEHYRRSRISTLHIAVLATNLPARRFYESLGGEASGTRDDPEGP